MKNIISMCLLLVSCTAASFSVKKSAVNPYSNIFRLQSACDRDIENFKRQCAFDRTPDFPAALQKLSKQETEQKEQAEKELREQRQHMEEYFSRVRVAEAMLKFSSANSTATLKKAEALGQRYESRIDNKHSTVKVDEKSTSEEVYRWRLVDEAERKHKEGLSPVVATIKSLDDELTQLKQLHPGQEDRRLMGRAGPSDKKQLAKKYKKIEDNYHQFNRSFEAVSALDKLRLCSMMNTAGNDDLTERLYNTMVAVRAIVHAHPSLVGDVKDDAVCVTAQLLADRVKKYCGGLQEVAQSLKHEPLNVATVCNGTACRTLLDSTKKYITLLCSECKNMHPLNEYCRCSCMSGTKKINPLKHTICVKAGQPMRLAIDELIQSDLDGRRKRAQEEGDFQRYMHEQNAWIKQAEEEVEAVYRKKAEEEADLQRYIQEQAAWIKQYGQ